MATVPSKKPSRNKKTPRARFRASWRGPLRFGLVSFDVQAVNAKAKERSEIHFHLLHEPDHQRIHYAKICPKHGEVPNDEIVEGYEYAKGRYIEVDRDELEQLRTRQERALAIDAFIPPEAVDPLFFDGRLYYLLPQNNDAQEPYSLLVHSMERQNVWGVGQVVFSGREQLVLVRPHDGLLVMAMLNYVDEMHRADEFRSAVVPARGDRRKAKLTDQLLRQWGDEKFDFADYKDRYKQKVERVLEAKRRGEKMEPEAEESPEVINLTEALKRSLEAPRERLRSSAPRSQAKALGRRTTSQPVRSKRGA